jgi:2-furoyl-CoA dehydrogenase large subunit
LASRATGRLYGIGFAAVVEPSISNMGYITTVLTPQERQKAGSKGGALAAATVALDPLGGVSVAIDSVPQGQGHRTVTAQVVADVFGLTPAAIRVDADLDTGKDAWSIAAGNYSSRFAGATAGTVHLAATRLKHRGRARLLASAGQATEGQRQRGLSVRRADDRRAPRGRRRIGRPSLPYLLCRRFVQIKHKCAS